MSEAAGRAERRFAWAAMAAGLAAFAWSLLRHPHGILAADGGWLVDWLQIASYDAHLRLALARYGEFPLWSPFLGGGYPLLANPNDGSLSPLTLLSLAFGEALGMKLRVVLAAAAGTAGAYLLARRTLRLGALPAAYAALVALLSGSITARIAFGGFFTKSYLFYFPLVLWLFDEGRRSLGALAACGALLALCMLQMTTAFAAVVLWLGLWAALDCVRGARGGLRPALRPAARLAAALGLAAGLGGAKLLPMQELLAENPRSITHYRQYQSEDGRTEARYHFYNSLGDLARSLARFTPDPYGAARVGPVALALAALGFAARPRRLARWALLAALFAILAFGPNSALDLYEPLWRLPVFGSANSPMQLFNFQIVVALALMAATGLDALARRYGPTAERALCVALLAGLALWAGEHDRALRGAFVLPAPTPEAEAFHQVKGADIERGGVRPKDASQYFNILRGVGTIDWDGEVLRPERAAPAYFVGPDGERTPNPAYRGEAYLESGDGEATVAERTPNRIRVRVAARTADRLVINQNFDPRWRADGAAVEDRDGLLALAVAPGEREIVLRFVYPALYAGAALSGLTAAALLAALGVPALRRAAARALLEPS